MAAMGGVDKSGPPSSQITPEVFAAQTRSLPADYAQNPRYEKEAWVRSPGQGLRVRSRYAGERTWSPVATGVV